jgi:hypothetical protein
MTKTTIRALALTVTGLATSCGYATPYKTSGAALSQDGVQIALVGERCFVNPNTDQFPMVANDVDDILLVGLDLQVKNESKQVTVLSLNRFRLLGDTRTEHLAMPPEESGVVKLAPGETRMVPLDFRRQTALDCHNELALTAEGAVAIEGKPVYVASIHFQPSR